MRADRHRRGVRYSEGGRVLLSTKHLALKGVTGKLKPRFVGPFRVVQLVGDNAVKLELPPAMKIHPVFNISLVKHYQGSQLLPAPVEVEGQEEFELDSILSHRKVEKRMQYLVSWKGYGASENMWLSESDLGNA